MIHTHINTNADIIQMQWNLSVLNRKCIYINFQYKKDLGVAQCKIHKHITYNMNIVTATNVITYLEYVDKLSCYLPLSLY